MQSGRWSITTMRALLALAEPGRAFDTMGDLMAGAQALMGKVSEAPPS